MRNQVIGIGVLAAVLTGGVQQASAQDTRAEEVLAKTRAALGRVASVKTLSVEASTQRNIGSTQLSSEVELFVEMPDKYVKREETRGMMTMTMATGFNGDRAITPRGGMAAGPGGAMIIRMGPGGPVHDGPEPTPEQVAQMNAAALRGSRAEASRFLLGWLGMAHPAMRVSYTYAGQAESPDGKAHVIDVKDGDGFESRLFIDQNNHLPLMVTYMGRAPRIVTSGGPMRVTRGAAPAGGSSGSQPLPDADRKEMQKEMGEKLRREMAEQPPVEFSLFFDDWREVDGVTFPHVMRRAAGGETSEEWTINKVKVNSKIDPKTFAVAAK